MGALLRAARSVSVNRAKRPAHNKFVQANTDFALLECCWSIIPCPKDEAATEVSLPSLPTPSQWRQFCAGYVRDAYMLGIEEP